MTNNIEPTEVLQYIEATVEPIPIGVLESKFCKPSDSAENPQELKKQLRNILASHVKLGKLSKYLSYYFANYMTEALEDQLGLNDGLSEISFSGSESNVDIRSNHADMENNTQNKLSDKSLLVEASEMSLHGGASAKTLNGEASELELQAKIKSKSSQIIKQNI